MPKDGAAVGVSDHGGWAVLVTAARDGALLDRRRIELIDDDLPALPHHHEGQLLPMEDAVALVERVRASAERHATFALDALDAEVPHIAAIALRRLQPLPPTIAERIRDHRARNVADWVMYRSALAGAAEARGWRVHWYDSKSVFGEASRALHCDFGEYFASFRRTLGAPWNADHKLALAAAVVAAPASVPSPHPGAVRPAASTRPRSV